MDLINQYNKEADKNYKDANFIPCPNCGRKFLEDRLELHIKGCKPKPGNAKDLVSTGGGNKLKAATKTISNSTKLLEEKLEKEMKNSTTAGGTGANSGGTSSFGTTGNKPMFLMCFICGREFGKSSLEIHLKQCYEKTVVQNNNNKIVTSPLEIPKELDNLFEKMISGEAISSNDMINYNEKANTIFKEKTMKQCPGCKRRFLPDPFEIHLRSCKVDGGGSSNRSSSQGPKMANRPRLMVCPLCGREFGSTSLPIHMKTCKDTFEREQENLPKNKRRSAEDIIEKFNKANKALKSTGDYNVENINKDAFEIFNKEALAACDICGRTFLPDRLIVHMRSCKVKKK